jgi:hypothetical protein
MDESGYSTEPDELADLREWEAEMERRRLAGKLNELESNGLYLRNLLEHINDKLVQPVTSKVVPAVTLGFTALGWVSTVALGAFVVVMKLR